MVQLVLDALPQSIESRNHKDLLALHVAVRSASVDIIQALLSRWPESLHVMSDFGTAEDLASRCGNNEAAVAVLQSAAKTCRCATCRSPLPTAGVHEAAPIA